MNNTNNSGKKTFFLSINTNYIITTHFRFSLDCNILCIVLIFVLLYCNSNYKLFPQISMGFFLSYTVWRINKVSIYLSICKIKIKFPNFILHSFEKPIMVHKRWSFHAVILDCHATVCSRNVLWQEEEQLMKMVSFEMITSISITWQIQDFARLWETDFKIWDSEIQNHLKVRLREQPKTLLRFRD